MSSNDFFPVELDSVIADNDALAKQGHVGKWIAKNRLTFKRLGIVIFLLALVGLAFIIFMAVIPSMRMAAAGFSYRFGENKLPFDSVRLESGVLVERVIEPLEPVTDPGHALLLLSQLENTKLALADVSRGYRQWLVSVQEDGKHNFTWAGAKRLAKKVQAQSPCVCYMKLGLPVNVVFWEDEVFYEPLIEREEQLGAPIDRGRFYELIRSSRARIDAAASPPVLREEDPPIASAARAMVQYITEGARMRRSLFDSPDQIACFKNCIAIYNQK